MLLSVAHPSSGCSSTVLRKQVREEGVTGLVHGLREGQGGAADGPFPAGCLSVTVVVLFLCFRIC